jgi:hypothetical protein
MDIYGYQLDIWHLTPFQCRSNAYDILSPATGALLPREVVIVSQRLRRNSQDWKKRVPLPSTKLLSLLHSLLPVSIYGLILKE